MMFHWKYVDERSIEPGEVGWFVIKIDDPDKAAQVAAAIDQKFANSPAETKTDTERAFSASFGKMLGNLDLLLGSVALAVVITTLFVAGNTMAMSVRERTTEIAVMRTLGFSKAIVFMIVVGEGLVTAVLGGALGALIARVTINGEFLQMTGGFIPAFGVSNGTTLTVMQLLQATNAMTDTGNQIAGFAHLYDTNGDGVVSAAEAQQRALANGVYTFINESGDL